MNLLILAMGAPDLKPLALSGNMQLGAAVLFGIALGLFAVKSELFSREACLGALTLREGGPIKILLTALALGVLAFVLLRRTGVVTAQVRPGYFWAIVIGGVFSGCGLAVTALTPVTALAALGAGRLYAFWVLLGMALAVPAVRFCEAQLGYLITRWATPMASSLEPAADGILALNSPPLWLAVICLVIVLVVHFTLPERD